MADNMISDELLNFLREEKDRREIWQCLLRYTRGVDRHDRALMLSAYHPDACDEHGVIEGSAAQLVDWALDFHGTTQLRHQHIITNHSVELDGDTAHGETYYLMLAQNREGAPSLSFGRYIDRFEKREGHWAIAHRVSVNEYAGQFEQATLPPELLERLFSSGPNRRDRGDVSYLRPLTRER